MEETTKQFLTRFMKCFTDLHGTDDLLSFMIKGHLHCESVLTEILLKGFKRPEALNFARLEYRAKLNLCNALGIIPESLVSGLAQLGKLRNRLSHSLDEEISEKDQLDLMNTVRSQGGPPMEYYLSKRTEFPNGLRRCIIGMLIELSLCLSDSAKVKKEMLISLTFLIQKASGLEIDEFFEKAKEELKQYERK